MKTRPMESADARRGLNGWRKRATVKVGRRLRRRFDTVIARYSEIPVAPVLDNVQFAWVADLERNWRVVRNEAFQVLEHRERIPPLTAISPDHKIARGGEWKSFFLWGYGFRVDVNCRKCPETARLVERIPGLQTAFFSILEPGGHIPPHRGVTKAIFNCHLGLAVPGGSEDCWISIDGRRYGWREGRLLAFDDTFRHEVKNQTVGERVVLLLQVRRPVRFPGSLAANAFLGAVRHSPFIGDARRNLAHWSE
jgi:beta-hydroxylase